VAPAGNEPVATSPEPPHRRPTEDRRHPRGRVDARGDRDEGVVSAEDLTLGVDHVELPQQLLRRERLGAVGERPEVHAAVAVEAGEAPSGADTEVAPVVEVGGQLARWRS